jgi:hypothetical protein
VDVIILSQSVFASFQTQQQLSRKTSKGVKGQAFRHYLWIDLGGELNLRDCLVIGSLVSKRRNQMKRVIAVLFVIALAFTMISGCASLQDVKKLQADTQAALDRAQSIEQKCAADAQSAAASARRAEDAANKAEAMAQKCQSIFMKHMKK